MKIPLIISFSKHGGLGLAVVLAIAFYIVSNLIPAKLIKKSETPQEQGSLLQFLLRWLATIGFFIIAIFSPNHLWPIVGVFVGLGINTADSWISELKVQGFFAS